MTSEELKSLDFCVACVSNRGSADMPFREKSDCPFRCGDLHPGKSDIDESPKPPINDNGEACLGQASQSCQLTTNIPTAAGQTKRPRVQFQPGMVLQNGTRGSDQPNSVSSARQNARNHFSANCANLEPH
jgi:hypothetical protein